MRVSLAVRVCLLIIFPVAAMADPIEDILHQRGPLFRKQIELTNTLSKLDDQTRKEVIDKFRSEYGSIQKYQQMEARLGGLARQIGDATVALNTEADRLASSLPTVAPAPSEFLTRQTMRLTTDAADTRVAVQIAAVSPQLTFDQLRINLNKARQLYANGQPVEPSVLLGSAIDLLDNQAKTRALAEAETALGVWNNTNERLKQAANQLKDQSDQAAQRVKVTVTDIAKDIAAANNVARAAQDALRGNLSAADTMKQYRKLFGAVLSNAERSRVLNQAVFGHLDQVVAISDAAKQISGLEDQIKSLNEGRSDLLTGIKGITGTMASVATSLQVAGLPPELASAVNKGIQYAQVAENVVTNIASGNWVGAALGAAGVFGGGGSGPSQEQVYHQEIMQGIHQILENQRIMIQGINQLLEGQQKILEGLHEIAEQMQENQRETLVRFDQLDRSCVEVKLNLIELQATDLNECSQLQNLGTNDWATIAGYLNNEAQRRPAYRACQQGIRRLIKTPIVPPSNPTDSFAISYFRLDNNPEVLTSQDSRTAASNYRDQIRDVFVYFNDAFPEGDSRNNALKLLWSAPLLPSTASTSKREAFGRGDLQNAFPTKINYAAVTKAVSYVLSAHQFMDLQDQHERFEANPSVGAAFGSRPQYDQVDDYGFSINDNLAALQKLDKLTDLAAAQQALLAGISLFPKIAERLTQVDPRTISLLKNYPTIAANYIRWHLRNVPNRLVPSANAAYTFAYQSDVTSPDVNYMRGFASGLDVHFNSDVNVEQCPDQNYAPIPKGWSVLLAPCLYVALPSITDFIGDTFLVTPGFYDMHDAKTETQDAIVQYAISETKDGHPVVDDELFRYAVKRIVM